MPPWKPAEGCRPLEASRRLSDADAATPIAWATGGTPQGDPAKSIPFTPPLTGLPWVDLSLLPDQAYCRAPA
jgi:hypothetical protein